MEFYPDFGTTGLKVSRLGLGAGQIGDESLDDRAIGGVLNRVLDSGITLIDTARGYGVSEERIGRHLSGRRKDFVLSTKVGYGIEGFADWTAEIIAAGIDRALRLMQTDYIDIVHLHSCDLEVLERGDVIDALQRCARNGKVRVAAYSGENEALAYAIKLDAFGSFQCSVNMFDQAGIDRQVANAAKNGRGLIAKRPIANAPWRFPERPAGHYCEEYWLRMRKMVLPDFGMPMGELAIRFSAYCPGVTTCIAGSADFDHIEQNLRWIKNGPLPIDVHAAIRRSFSSHSQNWTGQV